MDDTDRKITKIAREVSKFTIRTLHAQGISGNELDIIHVVRKNPGVNQARIAVLLGLDKGSLARTVKRLEASGYLLRTPDETDHRASCLTATAAAEELKLSKERIEHSFYDWLLSDLSQEEKDAFVSTLDRLYHRCKDESKSNFTTMTERFSKEAL